MNLAVMLLATSHTLLFTLWMRLSAWSAIVFKNFIRAFHKPVFFSRSATVSWLVDGALGEGGGGPAALQLGAACMRAAASVQK
jgi:hypothetical protein